nr:hypothetical protein Iba_chr13bCG14770 [Ipomoea batatas]GMD78865.1 hypothetical protein Iba_chr13cCG17100 [Ipomoea batatas]GME06001.1 hypothetical protein Iba_scaffold3831CG0420 [Ipomoea batatas]
MGQIESILDVNERIWDASASKHENKSRFNEDSFRRRIPFPSFCGRLLLSETLMETGEPPLTQSGVHTTDFQLALQTQLPTTMAAVSRQPAMTHLSCAVVNLTLVVET